MIRPLNEYPQQPLSDMQARLLFGLMLSARDDTARQDEVVSQDPMCQIIARRAEYHGSKFSSALVLMLACLSEGTPGTAVLYTHAMHCYSQNVDVTIDDFCHAFATGVPDRSTIDLAWDEQKINGQNGVDDPANWVKKGA